MNITTLIWNLFKFVYLPFGLLFGVLNESESMANLSDRIAVSLAQLLHIPAWDGMVMTVLKVLTAPSAFIAWAVPEGTSLVFLAPAAILGQFGMLVVIFAVCAMLAPPRFLQKQSAYD